MRELIVQDFLSLRACSLSYSFSSPPSNLCVGAGTARGAFLRPQDGLLELKLELEQPRWFSQKIVVIHRDRQKTCDVVYQQVSLTFEAMLATLGDWAPPECTEIVQTIWRSRCGD